MFAFALTVLVLAAIPAVMFFLNLMLFRPPRKNPELEAPGVSVLIPARNEAANIQRSVEAALRSEDVDLEVLVLDDASEDETPEIVNKLAKADSRVRLLQSKPLPEGWAGKMWACSQLSKAASKPWLLFVDADVTLSPDAARRLVDYSRSTPRLPALISGVPRQITGTWSEQMLIPLIPFVLLGYLPFFAMRYTKSPGFGSAIGQLMLAEREGYFTGGGHEAIRSSFHDGLNLPTVLRAKGQYTDLVDITELASCRMYQNFPEVWSGLLKNAGEGLGSPQAIIPMTTFLIGGQVLPWICVWFTSGTPQLFFAIACALSLIPRLATMRRFHQPILGILLHAPSVFFLEVIQWLGFFRKLLGISSTWKGRANP